MAYTTLANLKGYMPVRHIQQLTDDHKTGEIDTEVVGAEIARSQTTIDGYTRGRYPADMDDADVPDMITEIATALTALGLYRRRLSLTMPESLSKDIKIKMDLLKNIQKGSVSPFEEADEPAVIVGNKSATDRTYTDTVWSGY